MVPARDQVVLRLTAELTSIVSLAVDAVQDQVPAYRNLQGDQLADVEGIAYWSLMSLMRLWTHGADGPDEQDHARFRAIGTARAADGRPLTDVLRSYRIASSVFVQHVATEYLDDLEPADIAELSVLVLVALDTISEQIIGAYTATRERISSNSGQAQSALLDDLIVGRHSSPGALSDRTRELGLELGSHPHLLVIELGGIPPEDVLDAVAAGLDMRPQSFVKTRREQRGALLLPSSIDRSLVERVCTGADLRGCLVVGRSIGDVSTTYRLAADALDTAPAHAFVDRAVLDMGDAYLLALLTARPNVDTAALVAAVLGPLALPSNAHLLDGVAAFISTGTATAAAVALGVHPQTLRYRLRRSQELTGRDPRSSWHRLALDTAIQVRQLAERE